MSYSEFDTDDVKARLGVRVVTKTWLPPLAPLPLPTWLAELITRADQRARRTLVSELARNIYIVGPFLLAARDVCQERFEVFAGIRFDVDSSRGLTGEFDFLLSAASSEASPQTPFVAVVEAKKTDIELGVGQCVAQMVAARVHNESQGHSGRPMFGCVTTGEAWQFIRLDDSEAVIERQRLYFDKLDHVMAAFAHVADVALGSPEPGV